LFQVQEIHTQKKHHAIMLRQQTSSILRSSKPYMRSFNNGQQMSGNSRSV